MNAEKQRLERDAEQKQMEYEARINKAKQMQKLRLTELEKMSHQHNVDAGQIEKAKKQVEDRHKNKEKKLQTDKHDNEMQAELQKKKL